MTRPTLTTARLRLEPLTAERHTEELVDLDSDPEVLRHIFGRALTRREVIDDWMPRRTSPVADARGLGYWAGYADERFVGWWCLGYDAGEPDTAELGYRLRRDAWGRGYATEGGRALLAHAFDIVGLAYVWAETMAVNTGSRGVLAKLGLRLVGAEEGGMRYQITRKEYDAPRPR